MSFPHFSVLLKEILDIYLDKHLEIFVDGTLGAGGHSEAFLKHHPEISQFFGFDQDPYALEIAKKRLSSYADKCQFFHANFQEMARYLEAYHGLVDGILLDLGVSSMQLDLAEKGFSFSKDGPLDMRMNPEQDLSAQDIINSFSEEELGEIFREYGEERRWRKAAEVIVCARKKQAITTTKQLTDLLYPVLSHKSKIHPLTLIFQALRIRVNSELDVLQAFLPTALKLLRKGGRLAIISFHSLEDRIVKNFFKEEASNRIASEHHLLEPKLKEPTIKILTKKPIEASYQETKSNPRSRSAKLRVMERL